MACACGCSQQQGGSPCSSTIRVRVARVVRLPVTSVGELRGVIYRASREPGEPPKNYVHFFKGRLPMLSTNPSGTRLYIVGGQYRVGRDGIHG